MENHDSCLSILELFKRYVQNGSFGKTSLAFYRAEKGMISDFCSTPLRNSGIVLHGEYWTRNILEYPNSVEECSLLDVLEVGGGPAEVLFEREILQRSIGEGEPIREKIARRNGKSNKKSNKIKTIFCRANSTAKAECYENLSPTLTAHSGAVAPFISSIPPRHLMPIECERIQGLPR